MKTERWQQIERVYHAALELEAQGRPEYLAKICGSDEDLRKEVESLLSQDISSPSLVFNRAPVATTIQTPSAIGSLKPGERLGPYEIESQLGAGGMAEVWKARDPRLGRLV